MRNLRSLCGLAVMAAAVGCGGGSDQAGRGAQAPAAEPMPPEAVGQTPPSEPGMGAPPTGAGPGESAMGQPTPGEAVLSSGEIMMGTILCVLGPVRQASGGGAMGGRGGAPAGGAGSGMMPGGQSGMSTGQGSGTASGSASQSMSMGPAAESCTKAAAAAYVSPLSLYNAEASAIDAVRRMLETRLRAEGASSDMANNRLSFFDKGVMAAREARSAQEALANLGATSPQSMAPRSGGVGGGPASSSSSGSGQTRPQGSQSQSQSNGGAAQLPSAAIDEIRTHRALADLYEFGRTLGATQTGIEAQTLAWIIGVDRFFAIRQLPAQQRALAAEPLFSGILDVPPPTASGRTPASFSEYLAAAARSIGTSSGVGGTSDRAVGGGPAAGKEAANLQQVTRAAEERLQVLAQQLAPSSELRSEVDRTLAKLRALESAAATMQTAPPASRRSGQPPKPSQPSQNR